MREYVRLCDHKGRLLRVLDYPRPYPPVIYIPQETPQIFCTEAETSDALPPPPREFRRFYEDGRPMNEYWEQLTK